MTDIAVTQNFQTVDRFLAAPGHPAISEALNRVGRDQQRAILRRNAAEENNFLFTNWERAELVLGSVLFLILIFGGRPQKLLLGLSLGMLVIVAVAHFLVTPPIVELGRVVEGLAADDPITKRFWVLHGVYSGLDILKMLLGAAFAFRLVVRPAADKDLFAKEYDKMNAVNAGKAARG